MFLAPLFSKLQPVGACCTVAVALGFTGSAASAQDWFAMADGEVPYEAIAYGFEANGDYLFVCRGELEGGLHPGKIRPGFEGCNIAYGGDEYVVYYYDVLVADLDWVEGEGGFVPYDAVQAGFEANGDPLYLCIAEYNDGVHPGKIREGFDGCNIGWGGQELAIPYYGVIVE